MLVEQIVVLVIVVEAEEQLLAVDQACTALLRDDVHVDVGD